MSSEVYHMEREYVPRVKKRVEPLEVCQEVVKAGLGLMIVAVLAIINNNIHELVLCAMRIPAVPVPLSPIPPPTVTSSVVPGVNCTSKTFTQSLRLRVDVCHQSLSSSDPPVVAFYIEDSVLRVFSGDETPEFVAWLRRCTGDNYRKACLIYNGGKNKNCNFAPLDQWNHICYSDTKEFNYLVIDGFRLYKEESLECIDFILTHPYVSIL